MATTKIWNIKKRLDHVIDYTINSEKSSSLNYSDLHNLIDYANASYKTEEQLYVSTLNCSKDNIYMDMMMTKRRYCKTDGILGFHAIQSFNENEVTPELAHKIGVELANELWGDRFEVSISTHLNTNHIHNHFCINSISFKDGKRYYDNHYTYALMRETSDRICEEYNLNVLEEKKCSKSNLNYSNFYKNEIKNKFYKSIKDDIDFAIIQAYSFQDFVGILKRMEYEVINRSGKLSIRRKHKKRNIRIERIFGNDYTISKIEERIYTTQAIKVPFPEARRWKKIYKSKKKIQFYNKKKATGIRALYLYYCYMFKVFPKKNKSKRKTSEYMKQEVERMKKISNEARLLNKLKINTQTDFNNYKQKVITKRKELNSQKENLYKKYKKIYDTNIKIEMNKKIQMLSNEINEIRKEVMLLEDNEQRIPKINEEIKDSNLNLKERRKEVNEYI